MALGVTMKELEVDVTLLGFVTLAVIGAMLLGAVKKDWQITVSGTIAGALILYASQTNSTSPIVDPPNHGVAIQCVFLSVFFWIWFMARLFIIVLGVKPGTRAK